MKRWPRVSVIQQTRGSWWAACECSWTAGPYPTGGACCDVARDHLAWDHGVGIG